MKQFFAKVLLVPALFMALLPAVQAVQYAPSPYNPATATAVYAPNPYADATGTGDAIAASYPNIPATLFDGMLLVFGASAVNATTTPTFTPTLKGVAQTTRTLVKFNNNIEVPLAASDVQGIMMVVYDLPNLVWVVKNPAQPFAAASGVLQVGTGTGGLRCMSATTGLAVLCANSSLSTSSYQISLSATATSINAPAGGLVTFTIAGATIESVQAAGVSVTGALSTTGLITASSVAGIKGTAAADNAQAGSIGEYAATTAAVPGTALTTASAVSATSVSLSAGDWDVTGACDYTPAATTSITQFTCGINTTTATFGAQDTYGSSSYAAMVTGANVTTLVPPPSRINVSGATTAYLICRSTFTVSTMSCAGTLRARRIR